MFYGLAMEQDNYLSDHVSVFIALGPCTKFTHTKLGIIDQPFIYDRFIQDATALGINSIYGITWKQDLEKLCAAEISPVCTVFSNICLGRGQAMSV